VSLISEKKLPDNAFWRYFLLICSIPHPSGHEAALRDTLIGEARRYGLDCRVDAAGNLAIDRPAAAGCENWPGVILQAHLDMVPQVADNVEFDFLRDAVVPQVDGAWVTTGGRTTLGADDGMGVALAMELLTDPDLRCGALRGLFTVSEETGLGGAEALQADFLDGDVLINLDSDEPFTIGCAGGARLQGQKVMAVKPADPDKKGVRFTLKGMHGGHSGVDIHLNVGSAAVVMGEFLKELNGFDLSMVKAGTLHNAIAREAVAEGAMANDKLAEARQLAAEYTDKLNQTLIPNPGDRITLSVDLLPDVPEQVLTCEAQSALLDVWGGLPHGVLAQTADSAVETSSNLAVVNGRAGAEWSFIVLARSLFDARRDAVVNQAMNLLQRNGFAGQVDSAYSSWEPKYESALLKYACNVYRDLYKRDARIAVIHGGLEPGIFCGMKPDLQMISFAPATEGVHSPQEKLNIADSEQCRKLLRTLLERIVEM